MENRKEKQGKFMAPKKNNTIMYVGVAVIAILMITAGVFFTKYGGGSKNAAAYNIGTTVAYAQPVEMTDVANTVNAGKVSIDLEAVKKAGIIYTEYNQNGKKVALTAWIAQNGELHTSVSLCEPCRGYKFHIEGNDLVCNACGTRWALDTLQGISGGCLTYPPQRLNYEVKDGKVLLDEAQIQAWKPRV